VTLASPFRVFRYLSLLEEVGTNGTNYLCLLLDSTFLFRSSLVIEHFNRPPFSCLFDHIEWDQVFRNFRDYDFLALLLT
jgi:hypothetical protein